MRLATWNVNGLRARLDFIKIWLRQRSPDVVGMQELKVEEPDFPAEEFESLGYQHAIHVQKGWNGVGILSKHPMEVTQGGLSGEDEMGARLITADVAGISFTTVYVPNGKTLDHADYPAKVKWLGSLSEYCNARSMGAKPSILCGDFNVTPDHIDSWKGEGAVGKIFHTDEERGGIAALRQQGLTDLFRDKYPNEQKFSWWDYRGGAFHRGQGLRIDYLLGSDGVRNRVEDVWIDRDFRKKQGGLTASDHAPVIVDLMD